MFIVGQPGSGKSSAQSAVLGLLGLLDAVPLDSDLLLPYQPHYQKLLRQDDKTARALVSPDTLKWLDQAEAYVQEHRFDTVVSEVAPWPDRRAEFRAAGYRIVDVYMAVPTARSLLSMVARYWRQCEQTGAGRWVEPFYHDLYYWALLTGADNVERKGLADLA